MIQNLETTAAQFAYGVSCRFIESTTQADSNLVGVHLKAGQKTVSHLHVENETFVILDGRGRLVIDERIHEVKKGDVVKIPALSRHQIEALASLHFISVYDRRPTVLITPAPPTPNGRLHLGHAAGPYLASDVLSRSLKQQGFRSFLVSGTDDHQPFVGKKDFGEEIVEDFASLGVSFDRFVRPRKDAAYQKQIKDLYLEAKEGQIFKVEARPHPYVNGKPAKESDLSHICSVCGASNVSASCETCSSYTPMSSRKSETILKAPYFCDVPVILPQQPGIEVEDGQYLNVWIEMGLHYIALIREFKPSLWIPLYGSDNRYYYQVLFERLLAAFGVVVQSSYLENKFCF